jgi:hypothetical protein
MTSPSDVSVWLAGRNSIEFPMVEGRQILKVSANETASDIFFRIQKRGDNDSHAV